MEETSNLIRKTAGPEREALRAVSKLVVIGMPAVDVIIDVIRSRLAGDVWRLCTVLLQIRDPEIVTKLLGLLVEDNSDLALMAFKALGRFQDTRTVEPLQEFLLNFENRPTRRALAAEALGELGDSTSIDVLKTAVVMIESEPDVSPAVSGERLDENTYIDEDSIFVLMSAIEALAKLGDHEYVRIVVTLARYSSYDPYSEDEVIRANAISALQYSIGPGVFPALQKALHDDCRDVRLKAVDAIFYLGVKDAIYELIQCVNDSDSDVSHNALVRLKDLTGEEFADTQTQEGLIRWWSTTEHKYEMGACYRLGQPFNLFNVIKFLKEPHMISEIIEEIRITSGKDFGFNPYVPPESQTGLLDIAEQWWAHASGNFEIGVLYKYGHKLSLETIY